MARIKWNFMDADRHKDARGPSRRSRGVCDASLPRPLCPSPRRKQELTSRLSELTHEMQIPLGSRFEQGGNSMLSEHQPVGRSCKLHRSYLI